MSLRTLERGSGQGPADDDEKRRLSVFHLFGLAAGGVIGSGWLLGAARTYEKAGSSCRFVPCAYLPYLPWILGGLVMVVIAFVMVELGGAAPTTGGLIFLPRQSSGALVATVVAAGLWIFYAINLASEAVAMTRQLAWKLNSPKLVAIDRQAVFMHNKVVAYNVHTSLTFTGWVCVLVFMVVISAVNLVAPWIFLHINSWLTVVKVGIPVLAAALLIAYGVNPNNPGMWPRGARSSDGFGALGAVVSGGVVYAYMGFQGPLDFAGNIKRRGIGEANRLRWAIFGTIVGSMVLYLALQRVYNGYQAHGAKLPEHPPGPFSYYPQFASAAGMWLGWLLWIATMLAPMGAGLVFNHALTREVATLSRVHLTHRGLRTARNATLLKARYDVYWLVLVVNFFVALMMLVVVGGNWDTLAEITGVLALIVYAFQGVVLASLRVHLTSYSRLRRNLHRYLPRVSFALIALILYGSGWETLWKGMTTLAAGSAVLLLLPLLPRWRPDLGRIYDAKEHVTLFWRWRTSPAAETAVWYIGYLVVLTLLTLLSNHYRKIVVEVGVVAVVVSVLAFERLVKTSRRHMDEERPVLPTPTA